MSRRRGMAPRPLLMISQKRLRWAVSGVSFKGVGSIAIEVKVGDRGRETSSLSPSDDPYCSFFLLGGRYGDTARKCPFYRYFSTPLAPTVSRGIRYGLCAIRPDTGDCYVLWFALPLPRELSGRARDPQRAVLKISPASNRDCPSGRSLLLFGPQAWLGGPCLWS